jgi:hypothetical protein
MGVAVHREAAVVALQNFQVLDDSVGQGLAEGPELGGNGLPVGLGAVLHAGEVGAVIHGPDSWLALDGQLSKI